MAGTPRYPGTVFISPVGVWHLSTPSLIVKLNHRESLFLGGREDQGWIDAKKKISIESDILKFFDSISKFIISIKVSF